jgi:hypothetical protein
MAVTPSLNYRAQNVPELIFGARKATDTGFQKNQYWLLIKDGTL